ncbi:TPA: hypothetical protein ACP4BU_006186, partial [Pseudomonas aeruginosa]
PGHEQSRVDRYCVVIWRRKACTIFCTNRCEFWRIMSPESLDFTALHIALHREKNRMVIFAVEINFFTYRGLTHAWTVAIPVCYRFSAFRCAPSGAWVDPAGIRGVPQPAS